MKIWIDADACPRPVKEILYRASERTKIPLVFVANQRLALPPSAYITLLHVAAGPDIADDEIAAQCAPGDLVITADIPLAARVVEKGARALDPRGTLYTDENIKQVLAMRDFMDSMRGSGVETGGPPAFGPREKNLFAGHLDRIIAAARAG
jgi:uncharacterized protein